MKCFCVSFMFLFFALCGNVYSQYDNTLMFGLKAGVAWSSIPKLSEILVSEDYYSNYEFTEQAKISPAASFFFTYRNPDNWVGMELNVDYYQLASSIEYSDINTLDYTVKFQYHYLGIGGYLKVYPYQGVFVAPGVRVGFNLSPENITYTSNQEELTHLHYESASSTQASLREKIKGSVDFALGGSVGYEFPNGLSVQASYHYSLLDMIRTEYNVYNWIDTPNRGHSVQFMVGYAIGVLNR